MSDENVIAPGEKASYEKWKKNGRIKTRTVDIMGVIGIFIFGWLIFIAFGMAGKKRWHLFTIMAVSLILSRLIDNLLIAGVLWIVAIVTYFGSWVYIHQTVKRFEKAYALELTAAPTAS